MDVDVANLVVAAWLCGLIWTIQVVHYPLFAYPDPGSWTRLIEDHQRRITWIVLPMMVANVGLAVVLLLDDAGALATVNAAIAVGIFAATGAVFAPLHGRLVADQRHVTQLVRLNWARTVGWTAQVAVAVALL